MKYKVIVAAFMLGAGLLSSTVAEEPVVFREQTLHIPHGLVVADSGLQFFQDIRLLEQEDGSLVVDSASEGVLAGIDAVDVVEGDGEGTMDVVVQGNLSTPCDSLRDPMIQREGTLFGIVLAQENTKEENEVCAQVLDPFETVVTLDVSELEPGDYTVNVNGEEAGFTL